LRFFRFANSHRTDSGIYLRKINVILITHLSLVLIEQFRSGRLSYLVATRTRL
jgi:hypothetical protein